MKQISAFLITEETAQETTKLPRKSSELIQSEKML